jgi:hypothetical protein
VNEVSKNKFADRLATLIDGCISNHFVKKGKNPGASTRQRFRAIGIEKLSVYWPDEAAALKQFLDWQSATMAGTAITATGRIPNRDVPAEHQAGLEIYGMVNGRLASRGRFRSRGVEGFHNTRKKGKATVVEIPVEGSDRRQRYANAVSAGWVPPDGVVSMLMGINVRSIERWRDELGSEWEFTRFDWGWITSERPKVDVAKLQDLVRGLSPEDLQALHELLTEQQG